MKKVFFMIMVFFGIAGILGASGKKLNKEEVEAVKKACLDYVEGFFESDADRVKNGVNENLVKRKVKDNVFIELTRDKLIEMTVKAKREKPEIVVEVYDIYNNMASAKVTSSFVDFIHLAKINGKWQVVNVLWNN